MGISIEENIENNRLTNPLLLFDTEKIPKFIFVSNLFSRTKTPCWSMILTNTKVGTIRPNNITDPSLNGEQAPLILQSKISLNPLSCFNIDSPTDLSF